MSIWEKIFGHPVIRQLPPQTKKEVNKLLAELVKIGKMGENWQNGRFPFHPTWRTV